MFECRSMTKFDEMNMINIYIIQGNYTSMLTPIIPCVILNLFKLGISEFLSILKGHIFKFFIFVLQLKKHSMAIVTSIFQMTPPLTPMNSKLFNK